jgi:hypothetical protein
MSAIFKVGDLIADNQNYGEVIAVDQGVSLGKVVEMCCVR